MSLFDANMLPERVRNMTQMKELLHAEQIILDLIETVIWEMVDEASISYNIPMTKANTELIASTIAGCPCYVEEYAEILTIHIVVSRKEGLSTNLVKLRKYMNNLLPAHLCFYIHYELKHTITLSYHSEVFFMGDEMCGDGYAGEYPDIAWEGSIKEEIIKTAAMTDAYTVSYDKAGEYPNISTTFYAGGEEMGVQMDAEGYLFSEPGHGSELAGEYPALSTLGLKKADTLEVKADAEHYAFSSEKEGTEAAGEYPTIAYGGELSGQIAKVEGKGKAHIVKMKVTGESPAISTTGLNKKSDMLPGITSAIHILPTDYCNDNDYCGDEEN